MFDKLLSSFPSCLDDDCQKPVDKCFKKRTDTIFQCPRGNFASFDEKITYEEWVVEDVTASAYDEPLGADEEVFHSPQLISLNHFRF